jgi:RNA polymerase II-associated factor 1
LRPVVEDDIQLMEFFLPGEEDIGRLDDMYSIPTEESLLRQLQDLVDQGASAEQIDSAVPVSPLVLYDE